MTKLLFFLLFIFFISSKALAYDFSKDFMIMQDKLMIPTLLNDPPPKYFIKSDLNLITDYNKLKEQARLLEDNPSEENANIFLNEHTGRIKSADAKIDLGLTVGEFTNYEKTISWTTQIQFHAHWSLSAAIKNEKLTREDILNQFPKTIPLELKDFIASLPSGTDIISACRNSESLSFATVEFCKTFPTGVYIIPSSFDVATPNAYYFYKEDYKLGSYNYWNYKSFFGGVNLYVLRRLDQMQILNNAQIESGEEFLQWKKDNTTEFLAMDYTLGWHKNNHSVALNFTEMRLATLKKPADEIRPLTYGTRTTVTLQQQSNYMFENWSLKHFTGISNSGYDIIDGLYIGLITSWDLRRGGSISCLFMADSYFYTLGPQYNFHGLNIQYQYKMPSSIHHGELKPDSIQSLSLGLSF